MNNTPESPLLGGRQLDDEGVIGQLRANDIALLKALGVKYAAPSITQM